MAPTASNTGAATTAAPPVVAPSNVVVTVGTETSTSVPVSWSADDGGGTNQYTVSISPNDGGGAGALTNSSATSTTFTGLNPNTAYTVTVVASNGVAPTASNTGAATTSFGSAGAPTGVVASLSGINSTDVTVAWQAPANTGGGLGNYTVRLSNGQSLSAGPTATSVTFTSVAPGATVTATVQSSNGAAAPGATSSTSASVTTPDVPGSVTGLAASWAGEPNLTSINVGWVAPADNGGLAITGYAVSVSPALANAIPDVAAGETSLVINGLEQGTTYTVTVRAKNPLGDGPGVAASPVLVPSTPGTVTNIVIAQSPPFSSSLTVTWALPEEDGGSPITGYLVSVDGRTPVTVGPAVTSQTFSGLPVGTHNVTIQATTAAGVGATVTSPNFEVRAFPPFASEADFVTQLYADFLRRAPDAAGLAFWTDRVADDGSNVQVIVEAFMRSPEFAPRRAVARMYFAYLNRQPETGGFDFWTRRIATGQSVIEDVSQAFALSPEFLNATRIEDPAGSGQFRPLTDGEFIVYVYSAVLNRRPDQGGFEFWLDRLGDGLNRGTLMTSFSESPENIERSRSAVDVTVTYFGLLQRAPETTCNTSANPNCISGFAFWTNRVNTTNTGLTQLIREFYFSQEYANRVDD